MASTAFLSLAKKAHLSDGTTYAYVVAPPSSPGQATFLLLHRYPSSSYDWRHQIIGLLKGGYGFIDPDLLGYGETDKPTDPHAYRLNTMCNHMVEILDIENVSIALLVGRALLSPLASRLPTYHRHRCHGLMTIAVSYLEPGIVWNMDAISKLSKSLVGYETYGYWKWHNTDEAAN
ncbi:Alpha/Beta hydrolase protein [Aspergillus leporis]|uniref:Alpha/Beta hydrolase protein n=1 Tax=Aspergillus leporis TaxID=41062 RepID=A0A5N5XG63_9EURO|nr:Alpha/Beta hydrolase protein [Aspergillus leporis]